MTGDIRYAAGAIEQSAFVDRKTRKSGDNNSYAASGPGGGCSFRKFICKFDSGGRSRTAVLARAIQYYYVRTYTDLTLGQNGYPNAAGGIHLAALRTVSDVQRDGFVTGLTNIVHPRGAFLDESATTFLQFLFRPGAAELNTHMGSPNARPRCLRPPGSGG